jgi:hypothetical protein
MYLKMEVVPMNERVREDASTPTRIRAVTSYPARRAYRPGVVYPPHVPGVKDAIDIHCHGHEGQQDPLTLSQLASENGMGGLLFKTIGPISGDYQPMKALREVQHELSRWSEQSKIEPIKTWAGYGVTADNRPPSIDRVNKLNFKRAVIDHPFSPFIDLSVEQMKEQAEAGIYLNFTFDELSPLLGVDPQKMYEAIRAIGVHQVTLSSDAGEPLFPHSVECMRLIRGFMEAFGLNTEELYTVCTRNPGRVVGLLN